MPKPKRGFDADAKRVERYTITTWLPTGSPVTQWEDSLEAALSKFLAAHAAGHECVINYRGV